MDYRKYWVDTMLRIVDPVLKNLADGTLWRTIPRGNQKPRFDTIALEAFGRTACGVAPWLELEGLQGQEKILQQQYRELVRTGIRMATDPSSPDFMNFPIRYHTKQTLQLIKSTNSYYFIKSFCQSTEIARPSRMRVTPAIFGAAARSFRMKIPPATPITNPN